MGGFGCPRSSIVLLAYHREIPSAILATRYAEISMMYKEKPPRERYEETRGETDYPTSQQ